MMVDDDSSSKLEKHWKQPREMLGDIRPRGCNTNTIFTVPRGSGSMIRPVTSVNYLRSGRPAPFVNPLSSAEEGVRGMVLTDECISDEHKYTGSESFKRCTP